MISFFSAKSPEFETVPMQLIKDEKYFDVFITYDKVITLEPFQTITGTMDIRINNNYVNETETGAPAYSPPILLDNSNENSTSPFKSTELRPIEKEEEGETDNSSYSGSFTVTHTNARLGTVTEDLILQVLTTYRNGNNITYVPIDIPIPFLVILEDFNPLIYLFLIVLGVAVSLFITAYAGGSKISKAKILFWLVLSVVTAAVVFNQFKEALTPNSELLQTLFLLLHLASELKEFLRRLQPASNPNHQAKVLRKRNPMEKRAGPPSNVLSQNIPTFEYLTPHAFWNISDFGAKCEKCSESRRNLQAFLSHSFREGDSIKK